MAATDMSARSLDELRRLARARRTIQITIAVIFGVIIAVWLIGGYWRKNVALFISTIAMAISTQAALLATAVPLGKEIERRETAGER